MNGFSKNHPVLFGILLFFAALLAAVPFAILGGAAGSGEAGGAVGRIVIGLLIFVLFRGCFRQGRPFSGLRWMLPALLFPLWNVIYHLTAGMGSLKPAGQLPLAILLGIAPAIFEEIIFRGVLLAKLRENGRSPLSALWISSLLFGAVHLTNIVGMRGLDALVQTGYAVVIGLVFGAVCLKSGDIMAAILAHALIDVSSQVFVNSPTDTPAAMLAAFAAVLAVEAGYALWLTGKTQRAAREEINIQDATEERK